MESEKRIFLAYRAIFDANNAQIRQNKAIQRVVSQHRTSSRSLLQGLGEKHVLRTLKSLLERGVFGSEFEARRAFPDLFTTSPAQDVQHNASEADAARSEAEALEDIASLEGDRDEILDRETGEGPPEELSTIPVHKIANGVKIPSLYPLYIPYKNQHIVLNRTQRLLEECCYNFTAQWLPDLLEQRNWDCPEALELNKWTYIVVKRLGKLPADCFETIDDPTLSLADALISINKLRHSAVHRLSTTAKGISELIRSAARFAKVLRDSSCEAQLEELHQELEGKIRALELNKNFLETKLENEMQDIARQRRELAEKEREAVATMLKEDKDYGSLIGVLLSQSVDGIFDRAKTEEPGNTDVGRTSTHETEEEHEQETDAMKETAHKVEDEFLIEVEAHSTHDLNFEGKESRLGYQSANEAQQGLFASSSAEDESWYEQRPGLKPKSSREPPEEDLGFTPAPAPIPISTSEAIADQSVSLSAEPVDRVAEQPNLNEYHVPQEAQGRSAPTKICTLLLATDRKDLLAGILAKEVYTALSEAVDKKLSTYNFETGNLKKLSDKRIRRIRNFVEKRTNLDVALYQIELDDFIRIRFATFIAEMRPKTNFASDKKKSKRSKTSPKVVLPGPSIAYPTFPLFRAVSLPGDSSSPSPSPPPVQDPTHSSPLWTGHDGVDPILTPPMNPDSDTELKTFKLTAIEDVTGPGTICMLQIRKDGRVEGKLVVDHNDGVSGTAAPCVSSDSWSEWRA
ncbi:hypothetical protein MMC30_004861 [Trapelia coarctata]|nr:hypothetical protein [Trapelia coarctata]